MLLNELANHSDLIKAAGDAIKPYWKFKLAMVDHARSKGGETVIQFRLGSKDSPADNGYNTREHKQLDDKIQNALHAAKIKFKEAGFEEIEKQFSTVPSVSYTVVF